MNQTVTVEMPLTRHPPYRSQRALLTHWAPTLGSGYKTVNRLGVQNPNSRDVSFYQHCISFPVHLMPLTATAERPQPAILYPVEKEV